MASEILLAVVAGFFVGYLVYSLRWVLLGPPLACFGKALGLTDGSWPTRPEVLRYLIELVIAVAATAIASASVDYEGLLEMWRSMGREWQFTLEVVAMLSAQGGISILALTQPADRLLALVIADSTPDRG